MMWPGVLHVLHTVLIYKGISKAVLCMHTLLNLKGVEYKMWDFIFYSSQFFSVVAVILHVVEHCTLTSFITSNNSFKKHILRKI